MNENNQSQGEQQIVVFDLANESYGIDINAVSEIIRMKDITKVPRTAEFVEGVINIRGKVITVVDMRKRFGLADVEQTKDSRIVVVDINGLNIGMVVDAVNEVMRISESSVEPPSSVIIPEESDYLRGIAKLADKMIILLDLNRVLTEGEKSTLTEEDAVAATATN